MIATRSFPYIHYAHTHSSQPPISNTSSASLSALLHVPEDPNKVPMRCVRHSLCSHGKQPAAHLQHIFCQFAFARFQKIRNRGPCGVLDSVASRYGFMNAASHSEERKTDNDRETDVGDLDVKIPDDGQKRFKKAYTTTVRAFFLARAPRIAFLEANAQALPV